MKHSVRKIYRRVKENDEAPNWIHGTHADDFVLDFSDSWVIDMQSVNHFINI
jgi:hypothetical protein